MSAVTIEHLTKQHIKPLPIADQLRLAALIAKNLAVKLGAAAAFFLPPQLDTQH